MQDINLYTNLINILNQNGYSHIIDTNNNINEYIATGIGDILFKLLNMQENLVSKPIHINLNIFLNGIFNSNTFYNNPYNNFIFRINLLNDIVNNNNNLEKQDFIFVITGENCNNNKINATFNYRLIKHYALEMNDDFYINNTLNQRVVEFIKNPFIIFHTKLRLNRYYNSDIIKSHLNMFFSGLKIHSFNIILLGEQNFEQNYESKLHGITTIYPELLKLFNYNSNKILDLTKPHIYDKLDYYEYKNDICLIHKAQYNICYGQGGQLCSSLIFGKTIFFNPIDANNFYKNINLYNSGHKYFKRLNMMNKYLLEIL